MSQYQEAMSQGGSDLYEYGRRQQHQIDRRERQGRFGVPGPLEEEEKRRIKRHQRSYEIQRMNARKLYYHKRKPVDWLSGRWSRPTIEVDCNTGSCFIYVSGQPEDVDRALEELEEALEEAKREAKKRLEAFDGRAD